MISKEGRRRRIQRYKLDGYQPASITKSAGKGKKEEEKKGERNRYVHYLPPKRNLSS
jgi:hypothetical protein